MKRFVFRLQRVYEYKKTVETQQKAELADAAAIRNRMLEELQVIESALYSDFDGVHTVQAFAEHSRFIRRMRDDRSALLPKLEEAEREVDACRERLTSTVKELKSYEKLREAQLAEWRVENERSERSALEDFIAAGEAIR
ncbi:MAG: flagellar export protein FliJ [Oscillospiraceae bacterium]|jgi:flagellar FliJ protein|nr:flagellar export protein FliJ [Oscillospiraceae bacterium]